MKKAITTAYLGYTEYKPSRVKATATKARGDLKAHALTLSYEQGESAARNHATAAKQLVEKLGWHGVYIAGGLPDEKQNVYVALPGSYSRMWVDKYLPGVEGEDWFFVESSR